MDTNRDMQEMTQAERWVIALTVMSGAFIAVMDTSVVNVALPHMMGSFGQDLSAITWVATSYSIAEIIMVTMAGWWSALIGRKNLFLASFALFTLGSILCGTATSFTQMIIYRVLQGIGGGALIPVSQAILRETFPAEQQGMAMALYGMGVVLAPAIGPTFGGWLTDSYGWPWIFYINVPICFGGMMLVNRFVHDPAYLRRGVQSIDWFGIGLLAVSLTGMQVVLERGQEENWFESTAILWGTVVTVTAFLTLIIWELRAKDPVINLRVLKDRNLSLGAVMGLVFGVSLFGTTFILPQFTQRILGYSAYDAGLVMAPRAITLMLFMPLAGWLYRRVGARALITLGIGLIVWSYYDLTRLNTQAGFWDMVPTLMIMGAGMPFMFVSLSTVSLSSVDRTNMTDASSVYTLARRVGGNIGYAVVATLLSQGIQVHRFYLSAHVNDLDHVSQTYRASLTELLQHLGMGAASASRGALVMLDRILDGQATMMAYNDISLIFGFLFLTQLPFVALIPSRSRILGLIKARSTGKA
jgi:DHA2 family multidrug resistance protein